MPSALCPLQHAATASPLQRAGGLPDLGWVSPTMRALPPTVLKPRSRLKVLLLKVLLKEG